jgi:hypothetical protein
MPDSELVTWEACPECRQQAAVGWWHGVPVEFDCLHGCVVSLDRLEVHAALPGEAFDRSAL